MNISETAVKQDNSTILRAKPNTMFLIGERIGTRPRRSNKLQLGSKGTEMPFG